jgi:ParB family chromosome partitioning protein
VTESWLSRYLDLARLPAELMAAFALPQDLRIKHVTAIKPLLKPEDRRQRVFTEATRLAEAQANRGMPMPVPEVIRALALAADPPRGQVPQEVRKAGNDRVRRGKPLLKVEAVDRKGLKLILLPHAGGTRAEAEAALKALLDQHWS